MANDETNTIMTQPSASAEQVETDARAPYHAPTLQRFGGLAELVQRRPRRGGDGSIFPDCTLT